MEKNTPTFDTSSLIAEREFTQAQVTAKELAACSHAPSTLKKYEADWLHFLTWCQSAHLASPPSTVKSRLAAIRFTHKRAGEICPFDIAPAFEAVYRGYRRHWAGRDHRPAQEAATEDRLKRMVDVWHEGLIAIRNRAILLIGFDAALRRTELANLEVEHLQWIERGVRIHLPKSKGDPWGLGEEITIVRRDQSPYCPVSALKSWLNGSKVHNGPIFRRLYRSRETHTVGDNHLSDRSIHTIVKESAAKAGIKGRFGAHSLRRGFIHSAAEKSNAIVDVQHRVRHKSLSTTTRYLGKENGKNLDFKLLS